MAGSGDHLPTSRRIGHDRRGADHDHRAVFGEFLADQEARLGAGTYVKYRTVIHLFESYLERCSPGHDHQEYDRVTAEGGTYCGTFGPEEITGGVSEFLGYFMPHKVLAGKDTLRSAGTVTKKLAKWLVEKGYLADTGDAQELAREAARDLPASRDVLDLLDDSLDEHGPEGEEGEVIEDHFWIERIEPGKLWLKSLMSGDQVIGPVPVSKAIARTVQGGLGHRRGGGQDAARLATGRGLERIAVGGR